jgi:hypothetical protein
VTRGPVALIVTLCALACAKDARQSAAPDTVSDAAAAESAKAFSRAPKGTTVSMTVTGKETFDGPVNGRATCSYEQANGAPTVKVEAFGRDAQVAFEIINPQEGTIPVASALGGRRSSSRVSSLQFVVHSQSYGDGGGTAVLTDPVGRSGSLTARRFSRIGTGRRHGSDLAITVRWECE